MSTVHDLRDAGAAGRQTAPLKFPAAPYASAASYFGAYAEELARAAQSVDTAAFDRAAARSSSMPTLREATVFSCGNGGSASIANHLQCDHVKDVRHSRPTCCPRVLSLSMNVELLTAIANDLALSRTSSPPAAVTVAARRRARGRLLVGSFGQYRARPAPGPATTASRTIALTGFDGGEARTIAEVCVHVDGTNYGIDRGPAPGHHARPGPVHPPVADERRPRSRRVCSEPWQLSTDVTRKQDRAMPRRPAGSVCAWRSTFCPRIPDSPSGAHWFWTRVIPEMAKRLGPGEELHLLVSPKSRHLHQGYGPNVLYITYPWSNERRNAAHPERAPLLAAAAAAQPHQRLQHPDGAAGEHPVVAGHPHEDDARVHGARGDQPAGARLPAGCTIRARRGSRTRSSSTPRACAREIQRYLKVDERKLRLIYEAVDHDLFKPGDAGAARAQVAVLRYHQAVRALRVVAVAVQELRRAAAGLGAGPR